MRTEQIYQYNEFNSTYIVFLILLTYGNCFCDIIVFKSTYFYHRDL